MHNAEKCVMQKCNEKISVLGQEILEKYFKHENTLIMKLSGPYFIIIWQWLDWIGICYVIQGAPASKCIRLKLNIWSMNTFNTIFKNIQCFRLKYGYKISNEVQYLGLQLMLVIH